MNEIINTIYQDDIKIINSFVESGPSMVAVYCYGIGEYYGKKKYKLLIVSENIWKFQKKNPHNLEFTMYANMLYNAGYNYIDYLGIKHDKFLFDYTLINNQEFIKSLKNWENYVIADILQKPVITIKSSKRLNNLIKMNRQKALLLAVIMTHKEKTSFFNVMEKLYSISEPFSNDTLTFVDDNYLLLKEMYTSNPYFIINYLDDVVINLKKVRKDLNNLPEDIFSKLIIFDDYINELSSIKYLQEKMIVEQDKINNMQTIVNGYIKTFVHNNKQNKIKNLKRLSGVE